MAKSKPSASQYAIQREKEAQESNSFSRLLWRLCHQILENKGVTVWSTSSLDFEALASSAQADIDRMMMENINAFEQNPNVQSKSNPATIDDMLFGGVNDSTPCLEPQRNEAPKVQKQVRFKLPEEAEKSPTSTKADSPHKRRFSTDRFKPKHPSQKIEQPGFTKPAEAYSNLVRCGNTYSGKTFEHNMERNHGFKEDPTIMHVKGEIATCAITKGNGKKDVT